MSFRENGLLYTEMNNLGKKKSVDLACGIYDNIDEVCDIGNRFFKRSTIDEMCDSYEDTQIYVDYRKLYVYGGISRECDLYTAILREFKKDRRNCAFQLMRIAVNPIEYHQSIETATFILFYDILSTILNERINDDILIGEIFAISSLNQANLYKYQMDYYAKKHWTEVVDYISWYDSILKTLMQRSKK